MKMNSSSTDHIGPRFFCLFWAVVGLSIRPNLSPSSLYYFYNIPQAAYLLPAQSAKVQRRNLFHELVYQPQIQFQMAFLDTQLLVFFYVNSFFIYINMIEFQSLSLPRPLYDDCFYYQVNTLIDFCYRQSSKLISLIQ